MDNVYTSGDISEATGLSARLIQFYINEELIVPEIDNPKKRGKAKRYSLRNMMEFAILAELYACGITLQNTKTLMKFFRNEIEDPVGEELQLIFKDPKILNEIILIVLIGNAGFRMSENAEELLLTKHLKLKQPIKDIDPRVVLTLREVKGMPSAIILNINQIFINACII